MSTVAALSNHQWEDPYILSYPFVEYTGISSYSSPLLFSPFDMVQRPPSPTLTAPSVDLETNTSFNDLASDSSEYTASYGCTPLESVPPTADYRHSPTSYYMLPGYLDKQLWYMPNDEDMVTPPNVLAPDSMSSTSFGDTTRSSYYASHNGSGDCIVDDSTYPCGPPELKTGSVTATAATGTSKPSKGLTRECQCPMCPRAFARKHDLQRHIRVHTGVKPYGCPCCQRSFARTDALRRHFRMEETCRSSPQVQEMKTRRRKGRNQQSR